MAASIPKPFPAYEGDEPFLFVSYSHADKEDVYQDIDYLHRAEYRVWYDEGNRAGEDFHKRIREKIIACSYFVVFLTPEAQESPWVLREVLFGLDQKKPILPVYLCDLSLTAELDFPLVRVLKLKKYEHSREEYYGQLMRSIPEDIHIITLEGQFKVIVKDRIEQAGGWSEEKKDEITARLMIGADLLGLERERALKVLEKTLEELQLTGPYETFRKLVVFLLDGGEITPQSRSVLMSRATAWTLNLQQCEKLIQQEAASVARVLNEQGDSQAAKRLLVSAVGESATHSKEVRELLGQLDRKTALNAKPQPQYDDQRPARDVPSVIVVPSGVIEEIPQTAEAIGPVTQGETRREATPASAAVSIQEPQIEKAPQPAPASERAVVTIADMVSIAFRRIPAGEFVRGCPEEFIHHIQQKTNADVSVLRSFPLRTEPLDDFWISLTSITNAEYHTFVKARGHRYPAGWRGTTPPYPRTEAEYPVTGVTWQDCVDFADWLGARLPMRAEYEKACRGENGLLYPWGNDFDPAMCNTGESELGHVTGADAYPAGASAYGVLDLVGNVWEWTSDDRDQLRMTVGASYECSGEIYGAGFFELSRPPDAAEKDLGFRIACSDIRKLQVKSLEFQDGPRIDD